MMDCCTWFQMAGNVRFNSLNRERNTSAKDLLPNPATPYLFYVSTGQTGSPCRVCGSHDALNNLCDDCHGGARAESIRKGWSVRDTRAEEGR